MISRNIASSARGVIQGCPLSPILLTVYLNDMEEGWTKKKHRRYSIRKKKDLLFADDVAVIVDNKEDLREMIKELKKYTRENELEINYNKLKKIRLRKKGRRGK